MLIRLLLLLVLAAQTSAAPAPRPLGAGRHAPARAHPLRPRLHLHAPSSRHGSPGSGGAGGRRLFQDVTLGVPYRASPQGVARQKNTADLGVAALNAALGPQDGVSSETVTDFFNARQFFPGLFLAQTTFGANDRYGGAAKSSADERSQTTRDAGSSSVAIDSRSIAQPGLGRTSSAAGAGSTSLGQTLLDPGTIPPPGGSAPGPINGVVLASQLGVGVAGDYSVVTPDYQNSGTRDYDYGQVRPIPSTAAVDARIDTGVVDSAAAKRASSFGTTTAEATAPAAATRTNNIATNFQGQSFSVNYNDTIGTETRTDLYNPVRAGGAQAAGISIGRNYKFTQPSASSTTSFAGGAAGPAGGPAAASAGVLGFAAGRRSATSKGEAVSCVAGGGVTRSTQRGARGALLCTRKCCVHMRGVAAPNCARRAAGVRPSAACPPATACHTHSGS